MAEVSGEAAADWRRLSQAERDAAYDNMAAVPDGAERVRDWAERSVRFRQAAGARLDLAYGPRPRNRIDLFRSGADGAPLLAFFHGGYWLRNSKEMFAFVAEGPLALGWDVALIGYTLAPEASLGAIMEESEAALRWLRANAGELGVGRGALVAGGWSAGGHLAALALGLPEVDAGLAVSGIFDLAPLASTTIGEQIRLSPEEAASLSPIRQAAEIDKPLLVAYGAAELPELQRQSRDFWTARGPRPGQLLPIPGRNHYSVLEEMRPAGAIASRLDLLL